MQANGKIPHVLLLSGREGLGKSLFAHGIAASFFCRTGNACGECDQCTAVMAESHPEVFSLDTEGAVIKVEDAILVQQHLELHSQASYRIVIISDIDLLTQQASNRLLKTLEEIPPDFSMNRIFICINCIVKAI